MRREVRGMEEEDEESGREEDRRREGGREREVGEEKEVRKGEMKVRRECQCTDNSYPLGLRRICSHYFEHNSTL